MRLPAKGLPSDPDSASRAVQAIALEAVSAAAESVEQSIHATGDRHAEMMSYELTAIIERYQREPK